MVGLKKVEAGTDLVPAKARKPKATPKVTARVSAKEEEEEWGGITGQ